MYRIHRNGNKLSIYTIDGQFRGVYSWAEAFEYGYLQ